VRLSNFFSVIASASKAIQTSGAKSLDCFARARNDRVIIIRGKVIDGNEGEMKCLTNSKNLRF